MKRFLALLSLLTQSARADRAGAQLHPASIAIVLALFGLSSCGGEPPTAPSNPTGSLSGTVTAQSGATLSGATVRIGDGVNAGKSTTTTENGEYRFDGLAVGTGSVSAVADGYDSVITSIYISGTTPLSFTLRTSVPWSRSGIGSAMFRVPEYIKRVHAIASYTGVTSFFGFRDEFCLFVTDDIGTGERRTLSEGTYLLHSGAVWIDNPTGGVTWSITEERIAGVTGNCGGYVRPGSYRP